MTALLKILRPLALAAALSSQLWCAAAAAASVQDFTIPTFEGDYYLSRDSQRISHLRVHEHLVASFPEIDQNHGILRAIPDSYAGHSLNLRIQAVTNDAGQNQNYTTSTDNHNLVLKIGNPQTFVHGLQSYDIDYTMDNVTTGAEAQPAHIWNVNGTQWQQPFGQVTARLHLTSDLASAMQASSAQCFTGPAGSTAQDCTVSTGQGAGGDTTTTFTATRPLEPGETLTYEARFTAGTFVPYTRTTAELINLVLTAVLFYILPVLLTLGIVLRQWFKYGRDPRGRGVVIPQYLPPKDLSVISSSALLKESFQTKAISAQIIDLAVRHYLKIYEVTAKRPLLPDTKTYELELTRDPGDLRSEELATLHLLFLNNAPVGSRVKMSDFKNKLYAEAKVVGATVDRQLTAAGYFRTNPDATRAPYFVTGSALLLFTVFFLPKSLGLLLPGLILVVCARFMSARSQLGVDTHDYLLGLKMYMSLAEADRIKALQSPNGELTEKIDVGNNAEFVKLYERLLPYAILFGIEKDWAKQFAALYTQSPDWYSGPQGFSAGYFAGSVANFTTTSTASFTPPSSSGGGGFAGGGGGGGGGGGW